MSSCPVAERRGQLTPDFLQPYFRELWSDKVSPGPFLQAKQSQLPQPLLKRLVLQNLHQLIYSEHSVLLMSGLNLSPGFEVQLLQDRENPFPSPAGHTLLLTQDRMPLATLATESHCRARKNENLETHTF